MLQGECWVLFITSLCMFRAQAFISFSVCSESHSHGGVLELLSVVHLLVCLYI